MPLKQFNNNFEGINLIFCKNSEEMYLFIKDLFLKYPHFNKISFKIKKLNDAKSISIDNPKKFKYKNSIILADISLLITKNNGLSHNNIIKFNTPIFIFSTNKTITNNLITSNINRIIFSGEVLNKSKMDIGKYKYKNFYNLTDNFKTWIVLNNGKMEKLINFKNIDKYGVAQCLKNNKKNNENNNEINNENNNEKTNIILFNENNSTEYYLDNPIFYENKNEDELFVFF